MYIFVGVNLSYRENELFTFSSQLDFEAIALAAFTSLG